MNICLITPSFPPMVDGGVAISTGRLVERCLERGHQVTVISAAPLSHTEQDKAQRKAAVTRLLLYYRLVEDPLRAPAAVAALCDWVKVIHAQHPFDVILAYFVYPGGYLATLLGEQLGVPVVCSCRGNDISKDMFIDPAMLATVLQRTAHLIFVSDSLLAMADTLVPCRGKATVIANAVDSAHFVPAVVSTHRRGPAVVVGTSGILRWKKGLDLLLPLSYRLCSAYPEVRILLAGYGLDAAVDRQIADFLQQYGLQQRVEITGPVPHAQMGMVLQRMDVYVNTSYQEGMPNGVLEAMACALPVVATDADGTPALVEDGSTGSLCKMGDLEALVAHCSRLISQPALRRRFGRAGRARVQQYFRPDREAAAVEAVLHRACHSTGTQALANGNN
jgi:glycosyltransferase involved in cell wall biosynthesis